MGKYEKLKEKQRDLTDKIRKLQEKLSQVTKEIKEQENLQIINQIRALNLTKAEMDLFLSKGIIPERYSAEIAKKERTA